MRLVTPSLTPTLLLVLTLVLCPGTQAKMADLTHVLNTTSQTWPGFRDFAKTRVKYGEQPDGLWVEANNLAFAEHTGTHMDAPAHTWEGGIHLHQIPLEKLIGPAVVIDVIQKVVNNSDYLLTIEDAEDYEKQHGKIPAKSIVFMQTDGHKTYWDKEKYFGSETPENKSTLHYPAFGAEVITWLIDNRDINGVGVDRVSLDGGQNPGGPAHKALLGCGKFAIENVANLARIPVKGATVHVMPIFVENGSGGPVRLVAFWDTELPPCAGSVNYTGHFGGIAVMLALAALSRYFY